MRDLIAYATTALEAASLAIIMLGTLLASVLFLTRLRRVGLETSYRQYRADLGRGILIGLELLIAADILKSLVIDPTLNGLAVLAGIVVIRTFLSFSLDVEINGHWPWDDTRLSQHGNRQADVSET